MNDELASTSSFIVQTSSFKQAGRGGIEPPTCRLEGGCSVQLSYRPGNVMHTRKRIARRFWHFTFSIELRPVDRPLLDSDRIVVNLTRSC